MKRGFLALRPSSAMAVALVALFSSLVGGAAAATLITGDDIARNAIAKKHIKANAVRSGQVKNGSLMNRDFKAGQLGAGATGAQGLRGAKGDTGPAGPMDASLQKKTAESGQVFSGQIADHFSGNSNGNPFMILADSYPVPLPAGTPSTTVEYVPGAFTASCPGPGQSSPARLCVYRQSASNLLSRFSRSFLWLEQRSAAPLRIRARRDHPDEHLERMAHRQLGVPGPVGQRRPACACCGRAALHAEAQRLPGLLGSVPAGARPPARGGGVGGTKFRRSQLRSRTATGATTRVDYRGWRDEKTAVTTLDLKCLDETADLGRALISQLIGAELLIVDTETRILLADGEPHRLFDADDVVGHLLPDVTPEKAWKVLRPRYSDALDGHAQGFEYEAVSDDSVHSVRLAPIRDGEAVIGVMVLSQDITKRETARQRASASATSSRRRSTRSRPTSRCSASTARSS